MKDSKSLFWGLINFSLVVLITFGLVGVGVLVRYSNTITATRTITVSGEGEVTASPDVARINFAVVSQGANPVNIQEDNTGKMNKALDFVKGLGVAKEDIKTSSYNLRPRYIYDELTRRSKIDGYEIRQNVTITIRNLDKAGEIIGGLPAAGINEISGLSYDIENPDLLLATARQAAFNDAYNKASTMAKQNGVNVVRVVTFSESGSPYPAPMFLEKSFMDGAGGGGAPDLEAGSQEVTARVSVTYEIR